MANMSNYMVNAVLDHLTGLTTWTPPTTLYLALLSAVPAKGDTPALNPGLEIELGPFPTNGYIRKEINFGAEASQQILSSDLQTFGPSTTGWSAAGWAWIVDSVTYEQGNVWLYGPLATSKTAGADDSILFAIGEVIFALA